MINEKEEIKKKRIKQVDRNFPEPKNFFEPPEVLGNIEFSITPDVIRGYDEKNYDFYDLYIGGKNPKREHIVSVPIRFLGLAIDDEKNKFFCVKMHGKEGIYSFDDLKNEFKNYSITGSHMEKIVEFMTLYLNDKKINENAKIIHPDIIFIDDNGIIQLDNPYKADPHQILKQIYKIYEISTSPENFLINFAYFIIAPLSYYFRMQHLLFPYLINAGFASGGKTSFQMLFGNDGYAQDPLKSHFTRNDLKTYYTLMRSRSNSILPITLEDIELSWIKFQAQMLKGSAGTINGGSRGYFNRVLQYFAKSQLAFDTNDVVDVEIAQLDRFIVCNFPSESVGRVNIKNFEALKQTLPTGFMFSIFAALFGGMKMKDLIDDLYNVTNRDELKIHIIKYVIEKLNTLMPTNIKFSMPNFDYLTNQANATDWAAEIYNLGLYISDNVLEEDSKGKTYEINRTQIAVSNEQLFLTSSGFSLLQRHLNLPYKSIGEMNNNVTSEIFTTKLTTHRFSDSSGYTPVRCLQISKIPEHHKQDKSHSELKALLKLKEETKKLGLAVDSIEQKIKEIQEKPKKQGTLEPDPDKNLDGETNESKSILGADKISEIKNRILDVIKHGAPSNELSNIQRLINSDYGLDAEATAKIIKSLISENAASLDSFKKHLITYTGKQEPKTDEVKNEEKTDNDDTGDNLPGNPDSDKSDENEAPKKEEDYEHKPENPHEPPKILKIVKNFQTCYYKITNHFDFYPDSYFDGSDIILDSYKPIYQKKSTSVSYILLKVLIPGKLSQQPVNWTKFLADSQEISQKQFEVLSKGDSQ